MEQVIFTNVPVIELQNLITQTIKHELSMIKKEDPHSGLDELATRKQAANYLGVSLPTLHEYTKSGKVPAYKLGSRIRYKKRELRDCLMGHNEL
jgi:excisionase family DNA binding protein